MAVTGRARARRQGPRGTGGTAFIAATSLAGLAAGLAAYALVDVMPDHLGDPRRQMALVAVTLAFFFGFLASAGPLRMTTAALAGALVAVPSVGLLWAASFRFDDIADFLQSWHPVLAFGLLVFVALPFVIAGFRFDQDMTNYTALFDNGWDVVARMVAALAFVGLFWATLVLGDSLLRTVGFPWLSELYSVTVAPYALSGLALGLALGLVANLRDYVSPYMMLRLLRALLPVVALVMATFLGAVAALGPDAAIRRFGDTSAAATLAAMTFAGVLLVTSALDRGGAAAVRSPAMRAVVVAVSLMLPPLALLAALAMRARVGQYGWTPDRLAGATAVMLLGGYAVIYAVAVVLRGDWMQRIRRANVLMAAIVLLTAAAWLAPGLSPQAIAARSLEARIAAAPETVTEADIALLAGAYGRAGRATLRRLAQAPTAPLADSIAAALAAAEAPPQPPERRVTDPDTALRAALAVLPAGAAFPGTQLRGLGDRALARLAAGCGRSTPAGHPGCAVFVADFLPLAEGDEAIVFTLDATGRTDLQALAADGSGGVEIRLLGQGADTGADLIDRLHQGGAGPVAVPLSGLRLGDLTILPLP